MRTTSTSTSAPYTNHLSQIYKFETAGQASAFIEKSRIDRRQIDTVKNVYFNSQKPFAHDSDMAKNIRIAHDVHPTSGEQEEQLWTGLMNALQNVVNRSHFNVDDSVNLVLPDLRLLYATESTMTKDDLLEFVRNDDNNPHQGLFQECWRGAATPIIEGNVKLLAVRDALRLIARRSHGDKAYYQRMVTCAAPYVFRSA